MLLDDTNAALKFSTDTLQFDTVFSTVGSATRSFKIFNTYDQPLLISSIALAGGSASIFRMNVDGYPASSLSDIEIPANDSLYVFVEVTVDPNDDALPYVVEDSIIFTTNGNVQDVNLVAWGQNAHFHNAQTIINDTLWTNDLPHVIYNFIFVDEGATLTIDKGCRIYTHGYGGVYVQGSIKVQGAADSLVTFQGDRLEDFFKDVPGQWEGIFLLRGSTENEISYAKIFNSKEGIYLGARLDPDQIFTSEDLPFYLTDQPELTIDKTQIFDCQNNGIFSINSKIKATNILIYNVGLAATALLLGGDYNFRHCTMASYGSTYLSHQTSALIITDFYDFGIGVVVNDLTQGNFINSIVYGSIAEDGELILNNEGGAATFNYLFDHCFLRTDTTSDFIVNCSFTDPLFNNVGERDFSPDSLSLLVNAGIEILSDPVTDDLLGEPRPFSSTLPDIGCYETHFE